MPKFELVPIEEAFEAITVDTWLEKTFGREHGSSWTTEGFQSYIVSDGSGRVYEADFGEIRRSILSLEEAKGLITLLKSTGQKTVLFRVILEGN